MAVGQVHQSEHFGYLGSLKNCPSSKEYLYFCFLCFLLESFSVGISNYTFPFATLDNGQRIVIFVLFLLFSVALAFYFSRNDLGCKSQ